MGLPASEQRVLDTIEKELRITDQQLAGAFAAFTKFASNARVPGAERLSARHRLVIRLSGWRASWLHLTSGWRGTPAGLPTGLARAAARRRRRSRPDAGSSWPPANGFVKDENTCGALMTGWQAPGAFQRSDPRRGMRPGHGDAACLGRL